jgi:hypothetical protein
MQRRRHDQVCYVAFYLAHGLPFSRVMNASALVAGWPFAVLLTLYAPWADRAPLCGVVIRKDDTSRLFVLERDGIAFPIQFDGTTTICGVDGYPVSIDHIHVGDHVEVVECG